MAQAVDLVVVRAVVRAVAVQSQGAAVEPVSQGAAQAVGRAAPATPQRGAVAVLRARPGSRDRLTQKREQDQDQVQHVSRCAHRAAGLGAAPALRQVKARRQAPARTAVDQVVLEAAARRGVGPAAGQLVRAARMEVGQGAVAGVPALLGAVMEVQSLMGAAAGVRASMRVAAPMPTVAPAELTALTASAVQSAVL